MHLNIISILDSGSSMSSNPYIQTIENLSLKISNYTIINVHLLLTKKNNYKEACTENSKNFQNYNTFTPKSYYELYKFLKKKKFIIHHCIPNNFEFFLVNFFLRISSCKLFVISNVGYNPENFNYFNKNFLQKFRIFFKLRARYYFFRLFVLINVFPKIDYFFESSGHVINSINNGLSKKINRIFPCIDFSYYKRVFKISSKHYNPSLKRKISEDFIVFIDGMILDHKDVTLREGKASPKRRFKYYNNLNKILATMGKIYKKKIIICLHPQNSISIKKNDFPGLKCVKFKTEEYINKAFIVLFHEGSSITQAILLKKKIISLQGKILGDYVSQRCLLYSKPLGLKKILLDSSDYLKHKIISIKELNKIAKNNYNKYIKENLVQDYSKTGIDQVINYLRTI